jgi:hypothetical protein
MAEQSKTETEKRKERARRAKQRREWHDASEAAIAAGLRQPDRPMGLSSVTAADVNATRREQIRESAAIAAQARQRRVIRPSPKAPRAPVRHIAP